MFLAVTLVGWIEDLVMCLRKPGRETNRQTDGLGQQVHTNTCLCSIYWL